MVDARRFSAAAGSYLLAGMAAVVSTAVAFAVFDRTDLADVVMTYLLGIVIVSTQVGFRASLACAILSVVAFDVFFIPPYLKFTVADPRHVVTFVVMLLVAVVVTGLTQRVRDQTEKLAHALDAQIALSREREQLERANARAKLEVETEQMRSTLLSSVSHDLRTPLAVMKGVASTLADEGESLAPSTRKDLTRALVEGTEHLDRLIANLLDVTRLESGGVRVSKEWQSVEEVVGAAYNRIESRLEGRTITVRVPSDLTAPFDGSLVEQVIVNLLENAAKYAGPATPIDVTAARIDGNLLVTVSDRGPGVPEEERERIFEKFYRGASEQTKGGIGLGLTICRAIIAAHRGQIWVDKRDGGGATFKFRLPIEGEPPRPGALPEIGEQDRGSA